MNRLMHRHVDWRRSREETCVCNVKLVGVRGEDGDR